MTLCIGTLNAQLATGASASATAADIAASTDASGTPQAMTSGTAAIRMHYAGIAMEPESNPSASADPGGPDGQNDY